MYIRPFFFDFIFRAHASTDNEAVIVCSYMHTEYIRPSMTSINIQYTGTNLAFLSNFPQVYLPQPAVAITTRPYKHVQVVRIAYHHWLCAIISELRSTATTTASILTLTTTIGHCTAERRTGQLHGTFIPLRNQ